MIGGRRSALFELGLWALVPLTACSGRVSKDFASEPNGTGSAAGASSHSGGAAGAGGETAGAAGALGGTGGTGGAFQCCNLVLDCKAGDTTLSQSDPCPTGADCYTLAGCCGAMTYCAHFSSSCSLLGAWLTQSAPWNGQSTDTVIYFQGDGTLAGDPNFGGYWNMSGSTLAITGTIGVDMTCGYEDDWTVQFSSDCLSATLTPIVSGCMGLRRYLDGTITLTPVIK